MADKTKIDKDEVKKIKDFLVAGKAKVDVIDENETDRKKVTKAVLQAHGVDPRTITALNL